MNRYIFLSFILLEVYMIHSAFTTPLKADETCNQCKSSVDFLRKVAGWVTVDGLIEAQISLLCTSTGLSSEKCAETIDGFFKDEIAYLQQTSSEAICTSYGFCH
uniref:Saposin B-type domain-containing protein n=1 Tax=Trichobilharzia regenti TaxID=157069 RepID=A0AA85KD55_TRIRE|nr:unnamed protein product [Trichobilharzia regenti]